MADPRLRLRNIQAPSLVGVSGILSNANRSFNNAFDTADKILADYNTGQQEKEDAALAAELAGFKFEDDFGAFVDGGGLRGRNLSPEMQQTVLGLRKNLLGNDSTRASTESTRASTSRANAAEARTAFDFDDRVARTNALRGAAGAGVQAEAIGQVAGHGDYQLGTSGRNADVQRQVYSGLLARGVPEHVAQGFMMNFQDESGFNIDITEGEANVHGTYGKGLYQLTGDRREAFEAKYGNDYSIDNQLDFMLEELGGRESAAFEAIRNTTNAGDAASAIVTNFLRPAEKHRLERVGRYTGQGYTVPADQQNFQGNAGLTAYQQRLIDSGLFSMREILQETAPIRDAQNAGQARIDAENQQLVDEIGATALLDATRNSENLTASDVNNAVLDGTDGNLTSTEQLDLIGRSTGFLETPGGQNILAPQTVLPQELQDTADITNAAINSAIDATPQARMVGELPRYAENPTDALIEDLGLGSDNNAAGPIGAFISGGTSGSNPNDIKNLINRYASKFGVSDEVAAVAMREAFVDDPTSFLGLNANTLENRFPEEAVESVIKGQLSQGNIDLYRRRNAAAGQVRVRTENILGRIRQLQSQGSKRGADQQAIAQEIADLTIELSQLQSNNPITGGQGQ